MPTSHQLLRRAQDVCPPDSLLPAIFRHILGKLSIQRRQSTNQRHGERNVSRSHWPVSSFSSGKQIYEVGELREGRALKTPPPPPPRQDHTSQLSAETGQSHGRNSWMMRDHHPQPSSVSSRLRRKQVCLRLMKSSGQDAQPASIP